MCSWEYRHSPLTTLLRPTTKKIPRLITAFARLSGDYHFNNMSITRLSCTVYPNKKFSLGVVPAPKKEKGTGRFHAAYFTVPDRRTEGYELWLEERSKICGKFCSLTSHEEFDPMVLHHRHITERDMYVMERMDEVKNRDFSAFYDVVPPSEAPLLVKSPKSSRKTRNPYGQKGITTYGRRVVENSALLLERKYGRGRLGFVTCSLPSLPSHEHHLLNGVWGEVVRRFYQKLKRQLEKVSRPFIYVGVTEIQEKRFREYGVPAPHLHFCYLSRSHSRQRYWMYICQIHRAWNQAVQEGLAYAGSTFSLEQNQSWGSTHAKVVKKSVSAYLGKYMSKGCKVLEAMKKQGWDEFPKQWWTACMQCKEMFKASLIKPSQDMCAMLFYDAEDLLESELIAWMQSVWINVGGEEYRCGLTGTLGRELYNILKVESRG